ncbi:MAG: MerR family transcriptional regulator [Acidimicrobiales bacterium]
MAGGVAGEGYRIDDLARLAGTTVRNVRAYQDRGLLPAPVKVGRVGWYSEAHLARLRLVGEMLSRGYSLGNISELISGWARGQDLSDLLGLEAALIAPWGEDHSSTYSAGELQEMFPRLAPSHLERAVALELVAVEGDRYRVADPRLLEGANVLVEAGVPFEEVLRLGADVAALTDDIARVYVETVTTHLVGDAAGALAPGQVRRLAEVVRRLRPLAKVVVDAGLAAALERRIGAEVGEHLARAGGEPAAS